MDISSFTVKTTISLQEAAQSYATSITRALSIDENSKLYLACCWMSRDQKRYFYMYLTILGFDATHGAIS